MTVEPTPEGTYGRGLARMPRPLMNAFVWLNLTMFRMFGRRMRVMGRPLLLLTTVGATSGLLRQSPLCWFPTGADAWLIVASAAGSARHPAWYLNMAANPDKVWIEVGGRKLKVRPQSLKGTEREEAWKRVVALSPGYDAYQKKTDRQIPLVRLSPEQ